jgi:flavin-dependent dehydrogenase
MGRIYDALIVGAGPAGSSAAILLASTGWNVVVLEKARFPRRKVCGEYISGAAWPLLDALGVGDRVARAAGPEVRRVGLFADDHVIAAPMPSAATFRNGRALGREHLDTLLAERARQCGAQVEEGTTCRGVRKGGDAMECDYTVDGRERQLRARVVLGAHGAWETGALPTQPSHLSARPGDLLGFKAHFAGARLPADLMPLVLFPGGYGGMVTSDGGRTSLSCSVRRGALARARAMRPGLRAGEALLAHIVASNRGVRDALRGSRLEDAWLSAGPIRPAIRRFRAGGVFALGNAAGEAHPIIAEGISMAIQSSFLLAERLVEAGRAAGESRLDRVAREYERAWRANFAVRVRAAAAFATLTTRPFSRTLVVRALAWLPTALTLAAHWSGKDQALRRVPAGEAD